MSPFRPLAKRDRLRKSGELRFAGDGKPCKIISEQVNKLFSMMAISLPSMKNTKQILQILLDYEKN